jgi:glycosyltransferase involved in cell wall biosynthesis
MSSKIEISVVIPIYRVEKYIGKLMESLCDQTVNNFRVIIVDDSTDDESMNIILNYFDNFDGRIVVLKNDKNEGLSKARNKGIDYVLKNPTKYLAFLDSDDWIEPDYFEKLYVCAESNNLDLCIGGVVRIDEKTGKTICTEMTKLRKEVFSDFGKCYELAIINPCAYSKLFRFEPISQVRFRDIKRSEDTCYLFECLRNYKSVQFTGDAGYHYLVRNDSLTGKIDCEKYYSMHETFSELLPKFSDKKDLLDLFMAQIFIRSSIGGVCRVCFNDMRKCKELEKAEYLFLENNIVGWKKNKFLSFNCGIIKNKKIIAIKTCAAMYKIHIFFIFIWAYYIYRNVLKKEIRA